MTETISTATLDVRTIPPRDRDATIFSIFRELRAHDALVLVNDHEPQPLTTRSSTCCGGCGGT